MGIYSDLRHVILCTSNGEVRQEFSIVLTARRLSGEPRPDVQAELCDVIVTAMVALTTLTPDARETFNGHLARVASRSVGTPRTATGTS